MSEGLFSPTWQNRQEEASEAQPAAGEDAVELDESLLDFYEATRFYERTRRVLMQDYEGKYIAILDGEVVDSDAAFEKLALRVYRKLKPGTILRGPQKI